MVIGKLYKVYSQNFHSCKGIPYCQNVKCDGFGLSDFIIYCTSLDKEDKKTNTLNGKVGIFLGEYTIEKNISKDFSLNIILSYSNKREITYYKFLFDDNILFLRKESLIYESGIC